MFLGLRQGILKAKYHCTVVLLFDRFGLVWFANKNKKWQLSYSWFPTSQTGGQRYSDYSSLVFLVWGIFTATVLLLQQDFIKKKFVKQPFSWLINIGLCLVIHTLCQRYYAVKLSLYCSSLNLSLVGLLTNSHCTLTMRPQDIFHVGEATLWWAFFIMHFCFLLSLYFTFLCEALKALTNYKLIIHFLSFLGKVYPKYLSYFYSRSLKSNILLYF
jgi:hypothetical protein